MANDLYERVRELIIERTIAEQLYSVEPCITVLATIVANTQELETIRGHLVHDDPRMELPKRIRTTSQIVATVNRGIPEGGKVDIDGETLRVATCLGGTYGDASVKVARMVAHLDTVERVRVMKALARSERLHRERSLTKAEKRKARKTRQKVRRVSA
jgi:hypothetical protein